jgi:predicted lysophospholipase L1 biosynthesis ABC-type transport system permease subunit
VAIVNQALARALFGGENPIGRTIRMPRGGPYRIIGMVADTHYSTLHGQPRNAVWFAAEQEGLYMPTLFVKPERAEAGALMARIRQEFDAIDKGFPVFNARSMEGRVEDAMSRERMAADYASVLGTLALIMSAVGLYGVLSYAVVRRRREIGIRMALGSDAGAAVWLVARDALFLMAIGAAGGSVAALVLQPLLAQIVTIPPMGVELLAGAATVMAMAGLAAAIVPAMRAARTDPLQALHAD